MSENSTNNKKNKELEPDNKERNLKEYESNDKDTHTENNNNKLNQTNKKGQDNHTPDGN